MHANLQAIQAIETLLNAASTPPWRRAYASRQVPPTAALPAVLVFESGESSSQRGLTGYRRQDRALMVDIAFVTRPKANPEDITAELNAAAAKIETTLTLTALGSETYDACDYAGRELNELPDEDGNVSIVLHYAVAFPTLEGRPETLGAD